MRPGDIISNPDLRTVYEIPSILHKQELDRKILEKLSLPVRKPKITDWEKLIEKIIAKKSKKVRIAIVGKYFGTGEYQLRDSYAALFDAINHAAWEVGVDVESHWVDAEKVEKEGMEKVVGPVDGIIVPIGWGERGFEGKVKAASYAREKKIPYLGLCYGMQIACVAFARDIIGWKDANTTEVDPKSPHQVIHLMPKQKDIMERRAYGGTMRLGKWDAVVEKGTLAWDIYDRGNAFIDKKSGLTSERHRHRYEFNDDYTKEFEKEGFIFSARSVVENLVEIIELPKSMHPFYIGTQGHPEYKSRPLAPHPIFVAFMEACLAHEK
jgi:CTP synthase